MHKYPVIHSYIKNHTNNKLIAVYSLQKQNKFGNFAAATCYSLKATIPFWFSIIADEATDVINRNQQ